VGGRESPANTGPLKTMLRKRGQGVGGPHLRRASGQGIRITHSKEKEYEQGKCQNIPTEKEQRGGLISKKKSFQKKKKHAQWTKSGERGKDLLGKKTTDNGNENRRGQTGETIASGSLGVERRRGDKKDQTEGRVIRPEGSKARRK